MEQKLLADTVHAAVNVTEGALALDDRIKSLIIRPLCVILHSLRHDLIPVFGQATGFAAVTTRDRCQLYPDGHPNLIENHLGL